MTKRISAAICLCLALAGCRQAERSIHWVSIAVVGNHIGADGSFEGVVNSPQPVSHDKPQVVTGRCRQISGDLAKIRIETLNGIPVETQDSDLVRLKPNETGWTIVFAPGAQTEFITVWIK